MPEAEPKPDERRRNDADEPLPSAGWDERLDTDTSIATDFGWNGVD
jgi:hypothetical protein